jgi:hypothetical protein
MVADQGGNTVRLQKGKGMLAVSISLEVVAFAAMFGLGGWMLGSIVLGVTVLLLVFSLLLEHRHVRQERIERVWTYFAVNDRLGERARVRHRITAEPIAPAVDTSRLVWIALMGARRWGGPLARN